MAPSEVERRLLQLLSQGGLENALAVLRGEGATNVASVQAVHAVAGVNLWEAARIVAESQAWADLHNRQEQLYDAVLTSAVNFWNKSGTQPDGSLPTPTADEESQLRIMINKWDAKTQLQRAVCTAMIRGHNTPEEIGAYLGFSPDEIRESLKGLWGVLYDRQRNSFVFK